MKKIKLLSLILSIVAVLTLTGCAGCDSHDDHDHDHDDVDLSKVFLPADQIVTPNGFTDISTIPESEIKAGAVTSGTLVLRIVKIVGNSLICTHNNSSMASYVIINPDFEAKVDNFILCSADAYWLENGSHSLNYQDLYDGVFVIFAGELRDPKHLSAKEAASIFTIPEFPQLPDDGHDHDHDHDHDH